MCVTEPGRRSAEIAKFCSVRAALRREEKMAAVQCASLNEILSIFVRFSNIHTFFLQILHEGVEVVVK